MEPLLTVSLASTPGALTLRAVFCAAWKASSTVIGAATTLKVTVAVELPAGFCRMYLNVSAPVKFVAGV